ncbi:MAG TPA: type IX secretion system protein PorQ, partial [Saprospiraceae bacterium]|nr:type IX secretion system protein PorQ [Saprospiraceae bacterium]
MDKRQHWNTLIGILLAFSMHAQTGGRHIFQFVNLSPGARISALGGMPMAWRGGDPAAAYMNPSLLTESMSGKIQFAHQFYFESIGCGHLSYSHYLKRPGISMQLGSQFVNYGELTRTDEYGNSSGSFEARETNVYLAASRTIQERLIIGLNLQYLFSKLDFDNAQALSLNGGVSYLNPDRKYSLSFLVKQAGIVTSPYHDEREPLPFELQLGFAKKLKHLPLIYHITFQHLEKWNLRYDDPDLESDGVLFGEPAKENTFENELGNFLRHFVIGAELQLGKKEN